MKKLLGILVLGLLWCGTANAGLNEPGSKKILNVLKLVKQDIKKR